MFVQSVGFAQQSFNAVSLYRPFIAFFGYSKSNLNGMRLRVTRNFPGYAQRIRKVSCSLLNKGFNCFAAAQTFFPGKCILQCSDKIKAGQEPRSA